MLKVNCLRLQVLDSAAINSLIVQVSSAIAILVGGLVLIGWGFDIEFLKCGCYGSMVTMKANTALGLILCGVSLWLAQKVNKDKGASVDHKALYLWCFRLCTVAVTLIGLLTVVQYIFAGNLKIDEFLFRDSPNALFTSHPRRMGLNTALNLMLVGRSLELLVYQKTHRSYWYSQILALIAAVISLQAIIQPEPCGIGR